MAHRDDQDISFMAVMPALYSVCDGESKRSCWLLVEENRDDEGVNQFISIFQRSHRAELRANN